MNCTEAGPTRWFFHFRDEILVAVVYCKSGEKGGGSGKSLLNPSDSTNQSQLLLHAPLHCHAE